MDTREFLVEFQLRNACVAIFNDHYTKFRATFTTMQDESAVNAIVHGFTEYTQGYQRLTGVKAATQSERARLQYMSCERRKVAIGLPFSCNNIYHQSFHAVPAWERMREYLPADGKDVDFVPLIYPSAAVGKKMSVDPRKWHAWEFSLRPWTTRSYEDDLAPRTNQLLHAPCVCYERVYGNAPAFNPIARSAAPRMRAFRAAALHHAKRLLPQRWPNPELVSAERF